MTHPLPNARLRTLLLSAVLVALLALTVWLWIGERRAQHSARRARTALTHVIESSARLGPFNQPTGPAKPTVSLPESSLVDRVRACMTRANLDESRLRDLAGEPNSARATLTPLHTSEVGAFLAELRLARLRVTHIDLTGIPRSDTFTLSLRVADP